MAHKTMKELPENLQPNRRMLLLGASFLSDAELLAILLQKGTANKTALELAYEILGEGNQSLLNLYEYSLEDFQKISGIGPVKALQLKAVAEIVKRVTQTKLSRELKLQNAKEIASYYMEDLRFQKEEHFLAAFFNAKGCFLGDVLLVIGGSNFAYFSPKDVFKEAIRMNAMFFILIHNHPSGDPHPSDADIKATKRMIDCGEIMGIKLQDHIIIGDLSYYSLKNNHLI